jgi:hypothetical protein
MLGLLRRWRDRPTIYKAVGLFVYGVLTFLAISLAASRLFDNPLVFRIFELFWFFHIVYICYQLQRGQGELVLLALAGLSPGLLNNLIRLFEL